MAAGTNSDGFKFWHSYYSAICLMSDEQAGSFMKKLCAYVFDGVEPKFSSDMERFGFTLVADQAAESKRLYDVARAKGVKSGESRRKKSKKQEFSTSKTNTVPNRVPNTVPNVSRYVSSSFQEEEGGAAGAGPWGPAPPRLEDLPPIPGQRDTNGGDCE
jgi:hypothetical protein